MGITTIKVEKERDFYMSVEFITGDAFTTTMPAIGHGVNIYGMMGAGFAKVVATRYPQVLAPYKQACRDKTLAPGLMQYVKVETAPDFYILNLASQDKPGKHARLEWVESSMSAAFRFCKEQGLEGFAVPRIGANIGGLNWLDVKEVMESVAKKEDQIHLEIWSLPNAD